MPRQPSVPNFIGFIYLTPCIPLSFSRRGGRDFREGAKPPLTTLPPSLKNNKGKGARGIGHNNIFRTRLALQSFS
jgi:hypothetical protein